MYRPFVDAILAGEHAEEFEQSRKAGRDLSLSAAVEYALERMETGNGR
jgi:hypothetical protein